MATSIDLKTLSLEQLHALSQDVEAEIARQQVAVQDEAIRQMKLIAEGAGLTLAAAAKTERATKRGKVAPKYRNPANPKQMWGGRGKKPRWLEEGLASGKTLESFLIN